MTTLFAKGYGIYRKQFETFGAQTIDGWQALSVEERDIKFGEYFSAGISATVKQFRTDGAQMSESLSTLGSAATKANVPFAEQLAILGDLQTVFSGAESATKFKSFLLGAFKAGEKLDLDFVDFDTGQLKSIPDILDLIKDNYGGVIDAAAKNELKEAFGRKEAVDLIDNLIDKTDSLRVSTTGLNKKLDKGTAVALEMAKAMQRGPNAAFTLLLQNGGNLAMSLGKVLSPSIITIAENIQYMTGYADRFINRFPGVTGAIGAAGIALAGLNMTWIVSRYLSTYVSDGYSLLRRAYVDIASGMTWVRIQTVALGVAETVVAIKTKALAAAQWVLNAAMSANPIGWVIAGAAGLATAGYVVYQNWEKVKDFFVGIKDWFVGISLYDQGVNLINTFTDGIVGAFSSPYETVKAGLSKIRNLLPFSDAKEGPLSSLTESGAGMLGAMGSGFITGIPDLKRDINNAMAGGSKTVPGVSGADVFKMPGGGLSVINSGDTRSFPAFVGGEKSLPPITVKQNVTINVPPGASTQETITGIEAALLKDKEMLHDIVESAYKEASRRELL
jgi:TP901 family phage tail tape measure protein